MVKNKHFLKNLIRNENLHNLVEEIRFKYSIESQYMYICGVYKIFENSNWNIEKIYSEKLNKGNEK